MVNFEVYIDMLLDLKDVKKYRITPAMQDGVIIGVRVWRGTQKVFPGTLSLRDLSIEAVEYLKETVFKGKEITFKEPNRNI